MIRSYVESNGEMTESDCNVHEDESNQNDDEDNGGGSASDSGRSISSSVSTEPFFPVGQQQQQQRHQQQSCELFSSVTQTNDGITSYSSTNAGASHSQDTAATITNSQDILSYDELCNGTENQPEASDYIETVQPNIDTLQPLTIQLEQSTTSTLTTPTTSTSGNDNVSERFDEVEQILKAIQDEFKEQDIIVIDDDNADNDIINVYSSAEEGEQDGKCHLNHK